MRLTHIAMTEKEVAFRELHTYKEHLFQTFPTFSVVSRSSVSPYTRLTGCHGHQTCYLKHINITVQATSLYAYFDSNHHTTIFPSYFPFYHFVKK